MKTIRHAPVLADAALSLAALAAGAARGPNEQFFPSLVFRTGPYAPNGVPLANGFVDYPQPGQRARRRHQRR
jgi:branched-chain amino acid transport system substrate-binding protein